MIVRNEAKSLSAAIASFAGLADEVVIVDTGSEDDTVSVALDHGALVVRYVWNDDFSAARNAGFDACTGDWIFGLDADERLLPESQAEVRRLVATGTAEGYWVTRRDLAKEGYSEMRFMRLGRRDTGRRMVGRIHERFEPPITRLEPSSIVIEHDGYLPGRAAERQCRNIRLLEMELQDRPGQPYFLADLTHLYWLIGDPRWASTLSQTLSAINLNSPRSPLPLALALLEIVLASHESLLPNDVNHRDAEALAERWYPKSVPLLVARARLAFGRSDLANAATLGERAVSAWETDDYDRTISFDPAIVGAELRLNLGVALAKVGRLEESLKRFEEAAKDPRFASIATQNADAIRTTLRT